MTRFAFSFSGNTVLVLGTGVLAVHTKLHRESPQLSGIWVGECVLPQSFPKTKLTKLHQVLLPPLAPLKLIYEVRFQSDYIYSEQAVPDPPWCNDWICD